MYPEMYPRLSTVQPLKDFLRYRSTLLGSVRPLCRNAETRSDCLGSYEYGGVLFVQVKDC